MFCVAGSGVDSAAPAAQIAPGLYGKSREGLRHLLRLSNGNTTSNTLLTWDTRKIATRSYTEVCGEGYRRMAVMNELFAHEVKEEVLRELGRVGTPINPPPAFAMSAQIRWRLPSEVLTREAPGDSIAALMSYARLKDGEKSKDHTIVVLSDKFREWCIRTVRESAGVLDAKLANCLSKIREESQFTLKSGDVFRDQARDSNCGKKEAAQDLEQTMYLKILLFVPEV